MNEGIPQHRVEGAAATKGSMEGNVMLPQVQNGILLIGLQKIFASDDPIRELRHILAPIPLDDPQLAIRVKKAEAQHAHFKIGHSLTPAEVRKVETAGYYLIIKSLGKIFDCSPPSYAHHGSDEHGSWAEPGVVEELQAVILRLSPEKISIFNRVLSYMSECMKSEEHADLIKRRKDVYRNWEDMDGIEKRQKSSDAKGDMRYLARSIRIKTLGYIDGLELSKEDTEFANKIVTTIS